MTEDVGAMLREARERQGLTYSQVEEGTRIRARFVQALEENDYAPLGGELYVRGFLRNYAIFLGLSPDDIIAPAKSVVPATSTRETEILSVPLQDNSFPFGRIILMVLAFALVGITSFYLWQPVRRDAILAQVAPYLPFTLPAATATAGPAGATVDSTATTAQATPTQASLIAAVEGTPTSTPVPTATLPPRTPTPDLTATAAPTATPEPTVPVQGVVLALSITENAWTRVIVDNGGVAIERVLSPGETFEWTGQQSVFFHTGNAGGVEVSLNGQPLGVLGDRGAVIRKLWLFDPATNQITEGDPFTVN